MTEDDEKCGKDDEEGGENVDGKSAGKNVGRPKLPPDRLRTCTVNVNFSRIEVRSIQAGMKRTGGSPSLAVWIRNFVLRGVGHEEKKP